MAKLSQALQPWKGFPDARLDSEASNCINLIKAATEFSTLNLQATAAYDLHKAYSTSLEGASTGSRSMIEAKNVLKSDLAITMNQLAVDVNSVAKGDRELLLKTGMPLNKPNASPFPLQKPTGVTAVMGPNSGVVVVKVMEAVGATSIIFQYTLDPFTGNGNWTSKVSTRKTNTFTNLPAMTKIWFRVVSVGRNEGEIVSDMICLSVV